MIVYLDIVILSTIIVNYALIKSIYLIYQEKVNYIRLIIGLVISVLSLLLFLFPLKLFYSIRYFMGLIIGLVSFSYENIKDMLIKIVAFYLLNLAFIGTLVIFDIHNFYIMLIALLYVIILWIIESFKHKSLSTNIYQVIINKQKFKAFLDSGNQVYYEGLPVIFLKDKYLTNIYTFKGIMKINSVTSYDIIKIYQGPMITIINHKNNKHFIVYYAFCNNINYDVILNQELEGGIK